MRNFKTVRTMKKLLNISVVFILLLIAASCTKGWEDLNKNPNATVDVPAANILTYVERAASGNLFDVWNIGNNTDAYANQIVKIQYIDETRYSERDGTISARWTNIMHYQVDLNKIITKCTETGSENPAMVGVAKTISAMLWLIMTDTWGAIPYTQGAKGEEGILQPEYDSQEGVYTALLAQLADANTLLASGDGTIEGDMVFGNDAGFWQKFANSLRLRIAIRMSNVDEENAKTIITAILGNSTTYPIMTSNDDMAAFTWLETTWREPFAEDEIDRDDYGMCDLFINDLLHTSDPRLSEFAHPAQSDGVFRGIPSGADAGFVFDLSDVSRIGSRYRDQFTGKSYWMRYPEVCFLKAEAYSRNLAPGGAVAAETAYEEGVEASCVEHDATAPQVATYLSDLNVAWDVAGDWGYTNLQKIYYQKWVSLFKQGHEAWAETRRTDIPLLSAAPGSIYAGHTRPPLRWPYPVDEYNLNNTEVKKWDGNVVDRFWGEKMWWDTRGTGAH
jgi:hypothetical protein